MFKKWPIVRSDHPVKGEDITLYLIAAASAANDLEVERALNFRAPA